MMVLYCEFATLNFAFHELVKAVLVALFVLVEFVVQFLVPAIALFEKSASPIAVWLAALSAIQLVDRVLIRKDHLRFGLVWYI